MKSLGILTEDEILEQQRVKAKHIKEKHAEVNEEYFKHKFEREKNALQRKEFERLQQKAVLENKNCTFKPKTNHNRNHGDSSSSDTSHQIGGSNANRHTRTESNRHMDGLIHVPSSFRVEDRLIEKGQKVSQKKLDLAKQQQVQHFKPTLNKMSMDLVKRQSSRPSVSPDFLPQ
jgi:hypothetical protein